MSSEPYTTRAVVVRQVESGEADRVVTLLTEDRGRVSAIAKGAQRSRKRFGGALAYYVLAVAALRPRRGSSLQVLTRYDAVESFPGISAQLAGIVHASYLTEAAGALCPEGQPEPEFLGLLLDAYRFLDRRGPSPAVLRVQELRLLAVAGLAPQTRGCVGCGRGVDPESAAGAGFDVARGGVLCGSCTQEDQRMAPGALEALARLESLARQGGRGLQEAASLRWSPAVHVSLRRALTGSVLHAVGRPLKSLDFLRQLSRERDD